MSNIIDEHFVHLISNELPRYTIKHRNPFKVNFRCVFCGDSQKSKTKARAWLIENPKTSTLHYHCFNCGISHSFHSFLKTYNPALYNDYITQKYIDKIIPSGNVISEDQYKTDNKKLIKNPLKGLKKISQLDFEHPVKQYIEKRKIPSSEHYRIYYAPKFTAWINRIMPGKLDTSIRDEPRLVFPLIDKEGYIFGVSARSFNPKSSLRYITIMFEQRPKLFGLDKVDFTKRYFVLEGAIDSLFLKNAIAMVGADAAIDGLENINHAIFVHDAEPRNLEICKRMEKLLRAGHKVCIWPSNISGKDINDMILNGIEDVEKIIIENTFSGLEGNIKLLSWKKV